MFFHCFIHFALPNKINAQEKTSTGTALIDTYLLNNQVKEADAALQSQIEVFKQAGQIDSLAQYTFYVGKVSLLKSDPKNAAKEAETFSEELKKLGASKRAQHIALHKLSYVYEDVGDIQKAFNAAQESLNTILSAKGTTPNEIGNAYYSLCYYYYLSGKFLDANTQCKKHLRILASPKKRIITESLMFTIFLV